MKTNRSITVERNGSDYEVHAYASGSGALSLASTLKGDDSGNTAGISISEANIRRLRDTQFPDRLIVNEAYKHPTAKVWALVEPVKRIDDTHLKLDGRTYEIEKKDDQAKAPYDVYINHPTLGRHEVENLSVKGALNYYLKNEENILDSLDKFGNGKVVERNKALEKQAEKESPGMSI